MLQATSQGMGEQGVVHQLQVGGGGRQCSQQYDSGGFRAGRTYWPTSVGDRGGAGQPSQRRCVKGKSKRARCMGCVIV